MLPHDPLRSPSCLHVPHVIEWVSPLTIESLIVNEVQALKSEANAKVPETCSLSKFQQGARPAVL